MCINGDSLIKFIVVCSIAFYIYGCNDNNECDFDFDSVVSGENSEDINFIWNCAFTDNQSTSDSFALLLFKNGTGIRDDIGHLTWAKTGCSSFSYQSDSITGEIINLVLLDSILSAEQISSESMPFLCEKNPIVNISKSTTFSGRPSIAADGEGNLHVVWYELFPNAFEIFYSGRMNDGKWTLPVQISQGEGLSAHPSIAVDNMGTLHVAWTAGRFVGQNEEFEIFYSSKQKDGEWSQPINISNMIGQSGAPDIATDNFGNVHVVWDYHAFNERSDIYYSMTADGVSWTNPINSSNTDGVSLDPKIAVGQNEDIHVIWNDFIGFGLGDYEIFYSSSVNGKDWPEPINISNSLGESGVGDIALTPDNGIHVVFQDNTIGNYDIMYVTKPFGEDWSDIINVSNNDGDSNIPALTSDELGNLNLVWIDNTISFYNPRGNSDVLYSFKPYNTNNENWSSPVNISRSGGESVSPSITTSLIAIVWQDDLTGNNEIFYLNLSGE